MSDELFLMPSLGADMTEGTVLSWYVKPGDQVRRGDLVALINTEKADIEAEIWQDATIGELLVDVGQTVPVGEPLARLSHAAAATPAPTVAAAPPAPIAPATARPGQPKREPGQPELTAAPVGGLAALKSPAALPAATEPAARHPAPTYSPLVRREAERLHVDIRHLAGTGPGGGITRRDVEQAASASTTRRRSSPLARRLAAGLGIDLAVVDGTGPRGAVLGADVIAARHDDLHGAAPSPVRAVRRGGSAKTRQASNRQAVAELMSRSKREIPHYYLGLDIDCGPALHWLEGVNSTRPITARLLPAVLLLRATALAAADVPELNGHWVEGFRPAGEVALGVAVSLRGGGLLAPVLHRANEGSLDEMMARLNDLVTRARRGGLRATEMTDPSITVTNLGDQGSDSVYPVIYPPQVAMVGFGRIRERPWAEGGMVGARPVVTATLAGDHRASDGHIGARFLAIVSRRLAEPSSL